MQQTSRSKVAFLPLLLFIIIPVVAYLVFRKYGLIFFAVFLNPIGAIINQIFTSYRIERNLLIIKTLFNKKTISIDNIRYIKRRNTYIIQKLFIGLPDTYQILGYNDYDEIKITPRKPLVFNPNTNQLYFKN